MCGSGLELSFDACVLFEGSADKNFLDPREDLILKGKFLSKPVDLWVRNYLFS